MLPGFDSAEEDRKLRLFAVDSYVSLLQQEPDKLPQRFLQVISWVSLLSALWQLAGKDFNTKVVSPSSRALILSVYIGLGISTLISPYQLHLSFVEITESCFKARLNLTKKPRK